MGTEALGDVVGGGEVGCMRHKVTMLGVYFVCLCVFGASEPEITFESLNTQTLLVYVPVFLLSSLLFGLCLTVNTESYQQLYLLFNLNTPPCTHTCTH